MASLNQMQIIGRCGRDPETRYMDDGAAVTVISVATEERWKDKATGDLKSETEWHRCVFYGRQAEVASEYLRKGSEVFIQGRIKTKTWTDKDGAERKTQELIVKEFKMIGSPPTRDDNEPSHQSAKPQQQRKAQASDDEIPF